MRGGGERSEERQAGHSEEAVKRVEADLKDCLEGLAISLFGEVERRSEIIRDMYRLEFHLATR